MSKRAEERVAASVITYNRRHLLGECIDGLLSQSRPLDAIFIIDNASSDDTQGYLMAKGLIDSPLDAKREPLDAIKLIPSPLHEDRIIEIHYVRMHENFGSAGGQYQGAKRAYEAGFNWLWLMDDDGCPEENCLEELLKCTRNFNIQVVAPMVIDDNENEPFRFIETDARGRKYKNSKRGKIVKDFPELFPYGLSIFHGLLISAEAVSKIGYPKEELFIWGEEYDYLYRANRHYVCGTCTKAKFKHPYPSVNYIKCGVFGQAPALNDDRLYYLMRNRIFLNKEYFSRASALRFFLAQLVKYTYLSFHEKDLTRFRLVTRAAIHGFQEKFERV